MSAYEHWFAPDVTRTAAMAILHFVWQGAALAALAFAGMALARRASTRYAIAVIILALMVVAPGLTFLALQQPSSARNLAGRALDGGMQPTNLPGTDMSRATSSAEDRNPASSEYLSWLVEAWLAGVVLLTLRSAAGFVALQRLRRNRAVPLDEIVRTRCLSLQKTLGLHRLVRYFECAHLEAPVVIGWFRPAVFLPVSAISGLSVDQLDAIVAHELTHIRRLDAFVNLFQIAAETLLFYNPAVWWLSKRIRAERENCCDDVAIAVCGNAAAYARALASMAEWQSAPNLAMAANRGPLAARVARILGLPKSHAGVRGASLAASVLCLFASLFAGHALFGVGHAAAAASLSATSSIPAPSASPQNPDEAVIVITSSRPIRTPAAVDGPAPQPSAVAPAPASADVPEQDNAAQEKSPTAPTAKLSYIDDLKAAGLQNLSAEQLIDLKIQGVTADYVRELHALGLHPDVDEIIAMKIQGITPDFMKEIRDLGLKFDIDEAVAMKIQGVTPAYVRELRVTFPAITSDDLIAMKIQGIHPEYIREMHDVTGLNVNEGDIIAMKIQGVSPEYIHDLKALGLKLDADTIIGMKIQGVTPDFVKSMQSAGLHLDADDLISAKIQGITPEFIARARTHGFKDLDLDKLIQLKHLGLLDQ